MSKFSHFDLGPFARLGFRSPWWLIGHCWLVHNTVAILRTCINDTQTVVAQKTVPGAALCRMGNQQSGTRSAKTHIALLGDSPLTTGAGFPAVSLRSLIRWVVQSLSHAKSLEDRMGIDILYIYVYNCIYIYWCNSYWWISDGSRLDGAIDRCSSWSRTSHCVLETELWYLAWPGINSNPGHSDPFRCSTDSTKMQLGQNSTEAVVARAWLLQAICHVWYYCIDIIDIIACHRERHGNGKITSCVETEQQDNDDGHRDIDHDHGHGMPW